MRRIILGVMAAAIALIAGPGEAAAWLPADVRPIVRPLVATAIAATLLARYFDWRGNLRRRIAVERPHAATDPSDRERDSLDRAA